MSNQTQTPEATSKNIFLDKDIPSFSRWNDGKTIWIVGDKEHVWKDNKPTDIITRVFLVNCMKDEAQSWMSIDIFNQLYQEGKIKKGTIKTA